MNKKVIPQTESFELVPYTKGTQLASLESKPCFEAPLIESKNRKSITRSLEVYLKAQVKNNCPLCPNQLSEKKKTNRVNLSDIAHIYPLHPTPEELEMLKGEIVLNEDPNHEDNLIPLCLSCHKKYDTHKTKEEYRALVAIKKNLIDNDIQRAMWKEYSLESEVIQLINDLLNNESVASTDISYVPKKIDEKLDGTLSLITKRRIHQNVQYYFLTVKKRLSEIERERPYAATLISTQVKVFYQAQKAKNFPQARIYESVCNWIMHKTDQPTTEASEIVTAFFIQNCEVFE
ncbi:MAG: hypothetical protein Q7V02_07115 [Methylophilus sp.]|nr:hypothetical protein [Methylophilus sp.]